MFQAIVFFGVLSSAMAQQQVPALGDLCLTQREAALESVRKYEKDPGVEPSCAEAIQASREKCDTIPKDPGFQAPDPKGGTADSIKQMAAANQKTADLYNKQGQGCAETRERLGDRGECQAKVAEMTERYHLLTQQRNAAVGRPDFEKINEEWNELYAKVTSSQGARRAADQSAEISARCNALYGRAYQEATDKLVEKYLPLVAADDPLAGTQPSNGKAPVPGEPANTGPTAEKRAVAAAARSTAANSAKQIGAGPLAKKGFAGLAAVNCAKGDGVGCAVGVTQTVIDYSGVKTPWRWNPVAAAVGTAMTSTPTAGQCQSGYIHSPIHAALAGCRFRAFSVESLDNAIQLLEGSP